MRRWRTRGKRSRQRSRTSSRAGFVPRSVAVFGAAGFAGALAARLLYVHPEFELRFVTARGDVGRPLSELYPYHRVPMALEDLDLGRPGDAHAAVVAYPHGAAPQLVREPRHP